MEVEEYVTHCRVVGSTGQCTVTEKKIVSAWTIDVHSCSPENHLR